MLNTQQTRRFIVRTTSGKLHATEQFGSEEKAIAFANKLRKLVPDTVNVTIERWVGNTLIRAQHIKGH